MKPKDTKRAIDQLIGDIQDNEWYCTQNGSECNLHEWEKVLLVAGLESLFGEGERCETCKHVDVDASAYTDLIAQLKKLAKIQIDKGNTDAVDVCADVMKWIKEEEE